MANDGENIEDTNTNAFEIYNEWMGGENYDDYAEEFILDSIVFIDRSLNQLPIPETKYYFDDDVAENLQDSFHLAPCNLNIRLTGDDSGTNTKYVINFHFSLDCYRQPSQNVSVSLYRIQENGEVERGINNFSSWESVNPELLQMFAPDTRDEAVYDLFMALKNLDGFSVVFYNLEDVKDIISKNEKLLDVYRALNPIVNFVADDTVMPALPSELFLVPIDMYRADMMVVFQTAEKLVLGYLGFLQQDDVLGLMVIYVTDSADRMIEILSIIWDPEDKTSKFDPVMFSGNFIPVKQYAE